MIVNLACNQSPPSSPPPSPSFPPPSPLLSTFPPSSSVLWVFPPSSSPSFPSLSVMGFELPSPSSSPSSPLPLRSVILLS
ncbi:MAG TPA: hypothetical protein EYN51_09000 [Flavobacteriales bacterium]|nr:hypothetical protein [Flavobacteriales bacterium]